MKGEHFLVTGAQGCIGAWVIKNLLEMNYPVTAVDIDDRPIRLSLLIASAKLRNVEFVRGDIKDLELIKRLIKQKTITHVIHLAGLMGPDCRANPLLGATVNVLGTLTVFEAVKACQKQVRCIAYASSAAVLGSDEKYESYPIMDKAPRLTDTLYGVFKKTNEDCARVYWQDVEIRSVGLRPPVVYGPGRDRGLTAGVTMAIQAAVLNQKYEISFGGKANMEFADDVARCFIECVLKESEGANSYNMLGDILEVEDMICVIEDMFPSSKGKITSSGYIAKMPIFVSDAGLQDLIGPFHPITFREGARRTADFFLKLQG